MKCKQICIVIVEYSRLNVLFLPGARLTKPSYVKMSRQYCFLTIAHYIVAGDMLENNTYETS